MKALRWMKIRDIFAMMIFYVIVYDDYSYATFFKNGPWISGFTTMQVFHHFVEKMRDKLIS